MGKHMLAFAIVFLMAICVYLYFYHLEPKQRNTHGHVATPLSQVQDHVPDQVFHVSGNRVGYEEAQDVCKQLDARLATYDEVVHAYQHGAEWCNYGWSQDQLALYPTQKKTWEQVQLAEDPTKRGMCGHYGVNGGKFDKEQKFGVNCFGKRPEKPDPYFIHADLPKLPEKKEDEPKFFDDLVIVPYNRVRWERDYSSAAASAASFGSLESS